MSRSNRLAVRAARLEEASALFSAFALEEAQGVGSFSENLAGLSIIGTDEHSTSRLVPASPELGIFRSTAGHFRNRLKICAGGAVRILIELKDVALRGIVCIRCPDLAHDCCLYHLRLLYEDPVPWLKFHARMLSLAREVFLRAFL
jgi:hypothetical protein